MTTKPARDEVHLLFARSRTRRPGSPPYPPGVSFTPLLGVVCTALSLGFIWPQVIRVYRLRSVEGIAGRGTLHGLAGSSLWTAYGIAKVNPPLIISNTTIMLATVLIGIAQIRHRVLRGWQPFATIAGFMSAAFAMTAVSPALTGWVAIVVGATSILPQTAHVLRAPDLSGISLTMYAMLIATAVSWGLYGVLLGDLLVSAPNAIVIPCALVVAAKTWHFQRAARRSELSAPRVAADLVEA